MAYSDICRQIPFVKMSINSKQVGYPVLSMGVLPDVCHPGGPRPPHPPRPCHAPEDHGGWGQEGGGYVYCSPLNFYNTQHKRWVFRERKTFYHLFFWQVVLEGRRNISPPSKNIFPTRWRLGEEAGDEGWGCWSLGRRNGRASSTQQAAYWNYVNHKFWHLQKYTNV